MKLTSYRVPKSVYFPCGYHGNTISFVISLQDARSNQQHFPGSFIYGTWEGVWWAFVSMTTVG